MAGAFWGTRVLEIVKRNDSPGLLWKRIKLTTTRKANAKKRLRRVWQLFGKFPQERYGVAALDTYQIIDMPCKDKRGIGRHALH